MKSEILLIVLVIIASGCADTGTETEKGVEAVQEASESDTFAVEYTDSGFSPESIVIREGDSVKWLDRSTKELFITTEYDTECPVEGFSSCQDIEKFNYTFEEDGKYIYRNGHEITDQATVTVQQKNFN